MARVGYVAYTREAHKDTNDDGICDVCNRDGNIIVEIPFVKVVEQTGEITPGKVTFTFEIFEYGNSNAEGKVDIVANTITTNGKGTYNGVIKLKLTEEEYHDEGYLAEGVYIREKAKNEEGWTYSDTVWYALFNEQTGVWEFFVVENGMISQDAKEEMTFTNSYNAKMPVEKPTVSVGTKESPKTGDASIIGLCIVAMLASSSVVFVSKKRKLFKD